MQQRVDLYGVATSGVAVTEHNASQPVVVINFQQPLLLLHHTLLLISKRHNSPKTMKPLVICRTSSNRLKLYRNWSSLRRNLKWKRNLTYSPKTKMLVICQISSTQFVQQVSQPISANNQTVSNREGSAKTNSTNQKPNKFYWLRDYFWKVQFCLKFILSWMYCMSEFVIDVYTIINQLVAYFLSIRLLWNTVPSINIGWPFHTKIKIPF